MLKKPRRIAPFPIAVGQITQVLNQNTRNIKLSEMEFDSYLKMYFDKTREFPILDVNGVSRKGDIVLIRKLKEPPTQNIYFGLEKIIIQIDNIVDPITGRKGTHDEDVLKEHLEQYIKSLNEKSTANNV